VASAVFAIVSLAQLVRLVTHLEVVAGGHRVPMWLSGVAFLITSALSVWLWWLSKKS